MPFSNTLYDPSQEITGVFDKLVLSSQKKAKTHGLPVPINRLESDETLVEEKDQQRTFHVDKRAHNVFRTMFHSPPSRDHPGDAPWQDFLHSMMSTGFSAPKLQGSAWQFTPTELETEQFIQFHEPHPTYKLPFTWARRFGRRLAKTYGWEGDMFQLVQ